MRGGTAHSDVLRTASFVGFLRASRGFSALWLGQLISALGSGMTTFVLGVWAFERTRQVTAFAMTLLSSMLPAILTLPFAGVLVDRWSRKGALVLSTSVSAGVVAVLACLLSAELLQPWMLYAALAVNASALALQLSAMSAVTPQLVNAGDLARASGMMQATLASAQIGSPLVAGVLLSRVGLAQILWLDCASFAAVLAAVLMVRFPGLPVTTHARGAGTAGPGFFAEVASGWRYLARERGLVALLAFFAAINVIDSLFQAVLTPIGLTEATRTDLSRILSFGGAGMLIGTVVLSVWGGPRRMVLGVLGASALAGAGLVLAGALRSATGLAVGLAVNCFALPIINGCSQAIWQRHVPLELQGRVFAARGIVAWSLNPLTFLVAGPLVDRVFEPLLQPGGRLTSSLGPWIGVGAGRGMGLLLVCAGLLAIALSVAALRVGRLRALDAPEPQRGAA